LEKEEEKPVKLSDLKSDPKVMAQENRRSFLLNTKKKLKRAEKKKSFSGKAEREREGEGGRGRERKREREKKRAF